MKPCRQCGETKPLGEFYRHAQMGDGHLNKCKECVRARVTAHRAANLDRVRAYDRKRDDLPRRTASRQSYWLRMQGTPELKAMRLKSNKRWLDKNFVARRAHVITGNAIRDGKLKRQPCEVCGFFRAEAHHEDYYKPLEVQWLCREHHMVRHREINEERRRAA